MSPKQAAAFAKLRREVAQRVRRGRGHGATATASYSWTAGAVEESISRQAERSLSSDGSPPGLHRVRAGERLHGTLELTREDGK